jgi:drug/metabolite transporter (DMT)-like permease
LNVSALIAHENEVPWFAGAILAGGIVGPVLLMIGLTGMPASGASLLPNAEGVFTALLAWFDPYGKLSIMPDCDHYWKDSYRPSRVNLF